MWAHARRTSFCQNYPLTEKVILETPFTPLYCNTCIPVDDFRCWERGTERFLSRCFDAERDSGRIPHLFLQGWLNFSINLSKWAVEREGLCIVLFSIYQICPLVLSKLISVPLFTSLPFVFPHFHRSVGHKYATAPQMEGTYVNSEQLPWWRKIIWFDLCRKKCVWHGQLISWRFKSSARYCCANASLIGTFITSFQTAFEECWTKCQNRHWDTVSTKKGLFVWRVLVPSSFEIEIIRIFIKFVKK